MPSIKLIPEVAQVELHQVAPQVFELRSASVAPSLVAPSLTADLPTRFRELQQLSASQGHLEVVIVDEAKAAAESIAREGSAGAMAAVPSQRAAAQGTRSQEAVVAAAVTPSAANLPNLPRARPVKAADFYATVEAARPTRRTMRFFRLELANGIGIKGFARRMNEMLVAKGAPSSVLSDHRPFRQVRTEIQYRNGYAGVANTLSRRMTVRPALVKSDGLPMRTDVRIVLGRDLVHKFALRDEGNAEWLISEAAMRAVLAEVFGKG